MKKFNQVMTLSVATMLLLNPASVFAMTKNETIYSTLNYNGVIKKTTINTRLSDLEKGSIVDYTKLDDIKNINGREKFSLDSGTLTWKSTGKDIFYQGKTDKQLPIEVNIKYYLNNKEVKPEDIKGKKGKIIKTLRAENKVIVEGVHVVKKHQKPTGQESGGILEIEAPINASNVMIIDPKTKKRTRIGHTTDEKTGKKIRIAKKSNEKID